MSDEQKKDINDLESCESLNPEDEFETFASTNAPWVGAEKDWLNKKDNNASSDNTSSKGMEPPSSLDSDDGDDRESVHDILTEELSEDDMKAVAASIPPLPPPSGLSLGTKLAIGVTILVMLVITSAVVLWIYQDMQSIQNRELIAMRQEASQQILFLQQKISELSGDDGVKNIEMRLALKAQLEQAQAKVAKLAREAERKGAESEASDDNLLEGKDENKDNDESESRRQRHRNFDSDEEEDTPILKETAGDDEISDNPFGKEVPAKTTSAPVPGLDTPKDKVIEADPLDSNDNAPRSTLNTISTPVGGLVPLSPSRKQVKSTMDGIAARVKRCGNGTGGRIVIKLAVSGSTGRVTSAEPHTSEHVGTPVGICASRAVRLARFPKFQKKHLLIKYPFDL